MKEHLELEKAWREADNKENSEKNEQNAIKNFVTYEELVCLQLNLNEKKLPEEINKKLQRILTRIPPKKKPTSPT